MRFQSTLTIQMCIIIALRYVQNPPSANKTPQKKICQNKFRSELTCDIYLIEFSALSPIRSERAVPQKVIQAENSPPTSLFTSVI